MAAKILMKPIDTAFAILFFLLIAVTTLHISTAADIGTEKAPVGFQMAADLERLRALDRNIVNTIEYVSRNDAQIETKLVILNNDLVRIERALKDIGLSEIRISGYTRLVEPYMHIVESHSKLNSDNVDLKTFIAKDGLLIRALHASQFVIRNNITLLSEEQLKLTASFIGFSEKSRRTAIYVGLAAFLVFVPVRYYAGRAAAKPLKALHNATLAVADEHWTSVNIECDDGDAVGELVYAFQTMAVKLKESRSKRASSFQNTLAALVQTIEAKDMFTSNHSCNVSKLAEQIAIMVGLHESEVKEITCGALLHDIGKIGVPDEIINKPGKLTREEFSIIEEHPVIGDKIISPLDGSEVLKPHVRNHHEHWDGSGYPDCLKGEDIPLAARIITVADVFEALVSDRPYRKKMSLQQATHVMRQESGKILDPYITEQFIEKIVPNMQELIPELHEQINSDEQTENDVKPQLQSSTTTS